MDLVDGDETEVGHERLAVGAVEGAAVDHGLDAFDVVAVDASDEVDSGAGLMAVLVDTSNSEDDALMDS